MKALIFLLYFSGYFSESGISNTVSRFGQQEVLTIRIDGNRVECDGLNGRTQCYKIQKGSDIGSENWEIIPGEIENFRYEEGYIYDLSVEVITNANAPDEKSKFVYKLKEVLSKTKI